MIPVPVDPEKNINNAVAENKNERGDEGGTVR